MLHSCQKMRGRGSSCDHILLSSLSLKPLLLQLNLTAPCPLGSTSPAQPNAARLRGRAQPFLPALRDTTAGEAAPCAQRRRRPRGHREKQPQRAQAAHFLFIFCASLRSLSLFSLENEVYLRQVFSGAAALRKRRSARPRERFRRERFDRGSEPRANHGAQPASATAGDEICGGGSWKGEIYDYGALSQRLDRTSVSAVTPLSRQESLRCRSLIETTSRRPASKATRWRRALSLPQGCVRALPPGARDSHDAPSSPRRAGPTCGRCGRCLRKAASTLTTLRACDSFPPPRRRAATRTRSRAKAVTRMSLSEPTSIWRVPQNLRGMPD